MTDFRTWARGVPAGPGRVHVEPGPVAWIRFDHAATRNALDPAMMVTLADAADAVRGARVVILAGEHGTFCSGGNLGAVRDHLAVPGAGATFGAFMQGALDRLAGLDAIVIAAVEGAALGGGAEIVVAADIVVASPTARIGFVHAKLGVSPGFGGGGRLVTRVGPRVALRMLALGRTLGAGDAVAVGLVDEVDTDPRGRAAALAQELLTLPEAAVRGAKRIVRAASGGAARGGAASGGAGGAASGGAASGGAGGAASGGAASGGAGGAASGGASLPPGRAEELAVFAELWGGPAHRAALEPKR